MTLGMYANAGSMRPGSTRLGDMPTRSFLLCMSGPTRERVMPTATEDSITTVEPDLAYFSTVAMALRRYVVLIVLSALRSVGTEMRKYDAWLMSGASVVNSIGRPSSCDANSSKRLALRSNDTTF